MMKLIGEFDARVWVDEWMKAIKKNPSIPTDEGTMIAWFANAIMAGYDHARSNELPDAVEYFDRVICPFCGEDITDGFIDDEAIDPNDDFVCPVCGGQMQVEIDVDVNYKTTPIFDEETVDTDE